MNQQKKQLMLELQEYQKQGFKYVVKARNNKLTTYINKDDKVVQIFHNEFIPCKNERERDLIIKELSKKAYYSFITHYPIYAWGCIENTFRRAKNCSINTTFID